MGAPSAADYDLLSRLLEEGRSRPRLPPPAAAAPSPPPSPPPSSPSAPPCLEPRSRGAIFCARAIRGFFNAMGVLIVVLLVVPLATRCKNRDEVFICVFLLLMAAAFPAMGYVATAICYGNSA
ncbi:hypothetical protein ACP70R_015338 [Stipagrostis hirtigluma subsp. patula]